jgi:hypothetical protein
MAGAIIIAEASRRRRRHAPIKTVRYYGAFVDRFELLGAPQPPPPAAPLLLSGLSFAISDKYFSFCVSFVSILVYYSIINGFELASTLYGYIFHLDGKTTAIICIAVYCYAKP